MRTAALVEQYCIACRTQHAHPSELVLSLRGVEQPDGARVQLATSSNVRGAMQHLDVSAVLDGKYRPSVGQGLRCMRCDCTVT